MAVPFIYYFVVVTASVEPLKAFVCSRWATSTFHFHFAFISPDMTTIMVFP